MFCCVTLASNDDQFPVVETQPTNENACALGGASAEADDEHLNIDLSRLAAGDPPSEVSIAVPQASREEPAGSEMNFEGQSNSALQSVT